MSRTGHPAHPGTGPEAVTGPSWVPDQDLVDDARHAIATAPRDTAEDRFEAWAWRALLDEDGPALLTRAAAPCHLTASAVVLSPDGRATCLVLHGRTRIWVQPGGHLEPGDSTLAAAAAREVLEETGLAGTADPHPLLLSRHRAPCRPDVVDWHLDVQYLLVADRITPVLSSESHDVAWWDLDALPDPLASGVREVLARAAARLQAG